MIDFETALETSLASMQLGESTQDILARFPEFRAELQPLLEAAQRVQMGQSITPSPQFKEQTLTRLQGYMRANPRRPVWRRPTLMLRYAAVVATLALAFTTSGFALAQSALPGGSLYPWKLASERAWRSVHIDIVYVDLEITQRRLNELLAVQGTGFEQDAINAYAGSLSQLQNDVSSLPLKASHARDVVNAQKGAIGDALGSQIQLDDFYTIIPTLDDLIKQTPQVTPTQQKTENLSLVATPIPIVPILPSNQPGNSGENGSRDEKKNWLQNLLDNLLGN